MTPTEFRRLGHQVIDWLADYRERASAAPVSRAAAPGSLLEKLVKKKRDLKFDSNWKLKIELRVSV